MTSQHNPNAGLVLRRIEELFTRTTYRLLHLTLQDSHGTLQTLHTTAEHPVYALGHGWLAAGKLKPGDTLAQTTGQTSHVLAIESTLHPEGLTVYNLRVAHAHTYFVRAQNSDAEPLWVHNSCESLEYRHEGKGYATTDYVELQRQLARQEMRLNQIIREEGIEALQQRIRKYSPEVAAEGRAYVRSLGDAGEGMAWLHEPDMSLGGLPSDVFGVGSRRVNSIIGGNADRVRNAILGMPSSTTSIRISMSIFL